MPGKPTIYRRNLPHIHPDNYPIFFTFNLVDSLPVEIVKQLRSQREQELKSANSKDRQYGIDERYFAKHDEWLDRCEHGPHWLQSENIAKIVVDEIHRMENERYLLMAYCIMPNHVHLLIRSLLREQLRHKGKTAKFPVADTMRLLKGRTARLSNLELNRNGSFWHHESYDHYVRNEDELTRTILYIINNPVKAGLVREWKDWKFTYVNSELGGW
ncbi:MAG TPA: transposase [Anaerolineales bacterium]|nr:transposase [Anaerolineales bacterium]